MTGSFIVQITLPAGRHAPINDDTQRARWFVPDEITINYTQEATNPGTVNESINPWDAVVTVNGFLITTGQAGRRRSFAQFRTDPGEGQNPIPDWVMEYVEKYHPSKRV